MHRHCIDRPQTIGKMAITAPMVRRRGILPQVIQKFASWLKITQEETSTSPKNTGPLAPFSNSDKRRPSATPTWSPPHRCIIDSPVHSPCIVTVVTLAKVRRLDEGSLRGCGTALGSHLPIGSKALVTLLHRFTRWNATRNCPSAPPSPP